MECTKLEYRAVIKFFVKRRV